MAQEVNFPEIFEQLKQDVVNLAGTTVKNYVNDAKTDGQNMLNVMKEKLERWTNQLANGGLTTQDFEWLVYSQKELIVMDSLKQAGLAEIRIEQFKGGIINLVIDTIFHLLKI
jgi:hypothetical protein